MVATADEGTSSVQVRFTSKLSSKYTVTDTAISVPTTLKRYGLSEVVNHLLALPVPKPFVFLAGGEYLRSSLHEYIQARGLDRESVLDVEYTFALPPPAPYAGYEHDQWVSSVCARRDGRVFVSGSYDGIVRAWNASNELVATMHGHEGTVTALALVDDSGASGADVAPNACVSGSDDGTLRMWRLGLTDEEVEEDAIAVFQGHTKGVASVSSSPSRKHFVSGGWDSALKIWDINGPNVAVDQEKQSKKRRRVDQGVKTKGPQSTLMGHTKAVTGVCWTSTHTIYAGGWDHAVRQWDAETGVNVHTMAGQKVIHDMAHAQQLGLLITADADAFVRGWDPRASDGLVTKLRMHGHRSMVTSVAWNPTSPHHFVSSSIDGTVRVWDVRSTEALHTVETHTDKVLAVDWGCPHFLVSGGADKQMRLTEVDNLSKQ